MYLFFSIYSPSPVIIVVCDSTINQPFDLKNLSGLHLYPNCHDNCFLKLISCKLIEVFSSTISDLRFMAVTLAGERGGFGFLSPLNLGQTFPSRDRPCKTLLPQMATIMFFTNNECFFWTEMALHFPLGSQTSSPMWVLN